ncbi:MAG: hypothetical protein ACK5MD_11005 [Flavobacteriales bacterium]
MKKLLLLLLIITVATLSAQQKFTFDKNGLTDFVVVKTDSGLTQNYLFEKTINWVKERYKNPDAVFKSFIDNEKIRIEGFSEDLICYIHLGLYNCYSATYSITISFKDGRYKFDPVSLYYHIPVSEYYPTGGIVNIYLNSSNSSFYKKNGKIRSSYRSIPGEIEWLFNRLNNNLKEYIETDGDNDW